MTLFTWELYIWVAQIVNLLMLYLTQALSTLQWQALSVTIALQEASSSRSMTQELSSSLTETKLRKDARRWHTTCISPSQIRSYQRHLQSSHMDLQNYRDLFGKIILVFNLWKDHLVQLILKCNWNQINVRFSNSLLYISLKVLESTLMESLDFLHIKMRVNRSSIIYGH